MGKRAGSFFLLVILVIILATSFEPKSSIRLRTVGILAASSAKAEKLAGLKQGLADLGFVEGQNISYMLLNAQGKREKLLPLAQELVTKRPDVLIATGGVEADALKRATAGQEIPIIFIGSASSVEHGLVKSFLQPGSNLTGVDNFHAELAGKRLELLTKLLPDVRRVAVLYDPGVPPSRQSLAIVQKTAVLLDIEIGNIEVNSREEMLAKLSPETLKNFDALLPLSSFLLETLSRDLLALSLRANIPAMGIYGQETESGFFAAYGVSMHAQGYQGARLVAKVLDGQKPENIPVETPDNLELVVNLSTAQKLGLKLNATGLSLAKVLIK